MEKAYEKNAIIFNEGDMAEEAYIIRQGEVEILKHAEHGEVQLATLNTGDVFGEMGLFEIGGTRSATARARGETIVDTIGAEDFETQLNQCPPRIMPIILTVLDRLRSSNQRVSEKEQASVILDSDVQAITVKTASAALEFSEINVPLPRLPFAIGGYDAEGQTNKNRNNGLNLPSEGPPLKISRQHCQLEIIEGGLYLTDMGSRFTTLVNNKPIGRGKGNYRAALQKGENTVILGGIDSPYRITITCQ